MGFYDFEHQGKRIASEPGFIEELRGLIPGQARHFLEWGAGCSTLLFQELARERSGSVLSIDHTPHYLASVLRKTDPGIVRGVSRDLQGGFGPEDPDLNYGTCPLAFGRTFDFILIDGRRRVECGVTALALRHPGTVVVMHDYRRARYQTLGALYAFEDGPQFRSLSAREKP